MSKQAPKSSAEELRNQQKTMFAWDAICMSTEELRKFYIDSRMKEYDSQIESGAGPAKAAAPVAQ